MLPRPAWRHGALWKRVPSSTATVVVQLGSISHGHYLIDVTGGGRFDLGTGTSINGRLLAQTAVSIAGTTVTAPGE